MRAARERAVDEVIDETPEAHHVTLTQLVVQQGMEVCSGQFAEARMQGPENGCVAGALEKCMKHIELRGPSRADIRGIGKPLRFTEADVERIEAPRHR